MTQPSEPTVIITSDKSKLPPDIAELLDKTIPLPPDVVYFEKRYTSSDIVRSLMFAIGFGCAALIVIPLGIAFLFEPTLGTVTSKVDYLPAGFGLALAFASWLMFVSARAASRLRKQQSLGQSTRLGTYLTSNVFVQSSENDTTVIPPGKFFGLDGNSVKYEFNNLQKLFRLLEEWIDATPQQVREAIVKWKGG